MPDPTRIATESADPEATPVGVQARPPMAPVPTQNPEHLEADWRELPQRMRQVLGQELSDIDALRTRTEAHREQTDPVGRFGTPAIETPPEPRPTPLADASPATTPVENPWHLNAGIDPSTTGLKAFGSLGYDGGNGLSGKVEAAVQTTYESLRAHVEHDARLDMTGRVAASGTWRRGDYFAEASAGLEHHFADHTTVGFAEARLGMKGSVLSDTMAKTEIYLGARADYENGDYAVKPIYGAAGGGVIGIDLKW